MLKWRVLKLVSVFSPFVPLQPILRASNIGFGRKYLTFFIEEEETPSQNEKVSSNDDVNFKSQEPEVKET